MPMIEKQETYLDKVRKLDPKARLLHWIRHREQVRLAKSLGKAKPWTDDPILQFYRFCNCRRMDDKVSDWLLLNWYEKYFNHENMVVAAVLARHFNQPITLGSIGFPNFKPTLANWNKYAVEAIAKIEKLKTNGITCFNPAYIVRASGEYPNKSIMVFKETCQQFITDPPDLDTDSMEMCVEELTHYRNIGSFMAGQIAADLRWGLKGKWADKDKWAAIGPGSKRGMNRIQGREIDFPLKQEQFMEELKELMAFLKKALPHAIVSRYEAIDFQNHLCEIDKYTRVLLDEGRPKQKYNGKA